MKKIYDKLALFIICCILYILEKQNVYSIVPILLVFIFSAYTEYTENKKVNNYISITVAILSLFFNDLVYFLPLIIYNLTLNYLKVLFLLPLLLNTFSVGFISTNTCITIFILIIVSCILEWKTSYLVELEKKYINLRDTNKEYEIDLKNKNKELIDGQNSKIHLATINERNRIARDIHDNVGHILSSSILQIGALIVSSNDNNVRNSLNTLKETLDSGMNSIRNSIHNIYNDSIDLRLELNKIIEDYKFCKVDLKYDVSNNISTELKHTFIYVIKESLTNTAKHSNANKIRIILIEHPAIYKLVISDNGNKNDRNDNLYIEKGIGLDNIKTRIKLLNGNIAIKNNNGFYISIVIPNNKERT